MGLKLHDVIHEKNRRLCLNIGFIVPVIITNMELILPMKSKHKGSSGREGNEREEKENKKSGK